MLEMEGGCRHTPQWKTTAATAAADPRVGSCRESNKQQEELQAEFDMNKNEWRCLRSHTEVIVIGLFCVWVRFLDNVIRSHCRHWEYDIKWKDVKVISSPRTNYWNKNWQQWWVQCSKKCQSLLSCHLFVQCHLGGLWKYEQPDDKDCSNINIHWTMFISGGFVRLLCSGVLCFCI